MYKMYLKSAEGYKNANVELLAIKTTSKIWVNMKDVGSGIGVKNISDLVLKEIYGICETKNPTKKQVNEYKMTKREIYKKFTNLSKKELNTKNNKNPYVGNDVMSTIIKQCREEKTRGIRAMDGFRKKLMILDSEIPKCPEFEVKSKIGKIFKKHNPLEEYSVKIYEIDPYFYGHYEKNNKLMKMGVDICYLQLIFNLVSVFLAVEIDEKGYTDRDIIFEEKRQEALEKKHSCKFIRINTSNAKNCYDLDYRLVMYKHLLMTSKIKNKKTRKKRNKRKRNGRETRKGNEREAREENEREARKRIKRQNKN